MENGNVEVFESEENLELILVYSVISKTKVKVAIKNRQRMARSFAKLLKSISNGCMYSTEGEYVIFTPGSLSGGNVIFKCEEEISMYIVPLLVLCPFVSGPLKIRFKGITNGNMCVDMIRIAHFGVMRRFGVDGCELVVKKRGFGPKGEGEVILSVSGARKVGVVDFVNDEKIVKVRGLVLSSRVSSMPTREMTEVIKRLLGGISRVKVFSNVSNRLDSGPSPGFQCNVFAESKNGIYYSTVNGWNEEDVDGKSVSKVLKPEEAAERACCELLRSMKAGGIFDRKLAYLGLSLMCLSPRSVSRMRMCKVNYEIGGVLELLKRFFKFEYEIRKQGGGYVVYGCGNGYTNVMRQLK
ncbi:RNA 3'-terminal phosphate cyclase [Ordospora pajunii]|uniref:RNA 3'-terminal phosphate cyclase n=1 Tax=Ordospora pajunii TaxID=3039483 RepID=UPI0029527B7C|nr:RNA 3'-terminal phosphate cyclase [Ordospora pajunii]KAH9411226.1 RNA 3'-terminal phosphate cyclase [Ordospora pajunii]